jgi:outer membrane protein TolC
VTGVQTCALPISILSAYIKQIDITNQTVKQYEAAWREARAALAETRSSLFPSLSLDKSVSRSGTGKYNAATSYDLSATASWTLDVWGKLRRAAESDEAAAEASAADLAAARLSAQTAVATAYFALRAADEKQRILDKIVASDEITLGLVTRNYQAGVASQSERLSSQSALETARAAAIANRLSRAKYEHALAVLLGKAPADFELPQADGLGRVPVIPAALPSALWNAARTSPPPNGKWRRPTPASVSRLPVIFRRSPFLLPMVLSETPSTTC